MQQPDFHRAKEYALERLENELDPRLFYHNLAHTRDDVLPAATRLALLAGMDEEERVLLETAALYHDIGFVESRLDHELTSARIAAAALPRFGFNQTQIECIAGMILATRLPQSGETMLEALLCDADLDVLGREDFFWVNDRLRREHNVYGWAMTDLEWYKIQLQFLKDHSYLTPVAAQLRGPGKQKNITATKKRLETLGYLSKLLV